MNHDAPSEPVDWEQLYREGHTPWDKGRAHPWLLEVLQGAATAFDPGPSAEPAAETGAASILVPGCGTGHDVAALAHRFPARRVTGIDVAPSALAAARERTAQLPNADIIEANLFHPPASWRGAWQVVFEHTCLSALHPSLRRDYAAAVRELLTPGGRLVAVFFLEPDMDPGEQGPPFGVTREELDAMLDPGFRLVESRFPIPTYEGRERREEWRVYEAW